MLSLSTMQKNCWPGSINGHGLMYACVHVSVCGADPVCLCVCVEAHTLVPVCGGRRRTLVSSSILYLVFYCMCSVYVCPWVVQHTGGSQKTTCRS